MRSGAGGNGFTMGRFWHNSSTDSAGRHVETWGGAHSVFFLSDVSNNVSHSLLSSVSARGSKRSYTGK